MYKNHTRRGFTQNAVGQAMPDLQPPYFAHAASTSARGTENKFYLKREKVSLSCAACGTVERDTLSLHYLISSLSLHYV